jgi:hypothetical protein
MFIYILYTFIYHNDFLVFLINNVSLTSQMEINIKIEDMHDQYELIKLDKVHDHLEWVEWHFNYKVVFQVLCYLRLR